jgi:hypothetical protein
MNANLQIRNQYPNLTTKSDCYIVIIIVCKLIHTKFEEVLITVSGFHKKAMK